VSWAGGKKDAKAQGAGTGFGELVDFTEADVRGELLTFDGYGFCIDGTGAQGALDNLFGQNVYRTETVRRCTFYLNFQV
jgi:hypothetical protein